MSDTLIFFIKNIFEDLNNKINEDVIVVNQMGILFELYSLADKAFVGGGSHFRVHNVLEPFAFFVPIAFGPFYYNSHEACDLIDKNLAVAITGEAQLSKWVSQSEGKCANIKELNILLDSSKKIAHCLVG